MYRVEITEMTTHPVDKREWKKVADSGNERDQGAVYDYVAYPDFEVERRVVLLVEQEAVDITRVVQALF